MKDLYIEGVASRGGPESCVGVREGVSEALTGAMRAGLLSRERPNLGCRRRAKMRKATSVTALLASRQRTPRGRRTRARIEVSMFENREVPRSPALAGCLGRAAGERLRP